MEPARCSRPTALRCSRRCGSCCCCGRRTWTRPEPPVVWWPVAAGRRAMALKAEGVVSARQDLMSLSGHQGRIVKSVPKMIPNCEYVGGGKIRESCFAQGWGCCCCCCWCCCCCCCCCCCLSFFRSLFVLSLAWLLVAFGDPCLTSSEALLDSWTSDLNTFFKNLIKAQQDHCSNRCFREVNYMSCLGSRNNAQTNLEWETK